MMLPDYDYGDPDPQKRKHFWADLSEVWGVWHEPNSRVRHRMPCYDLTYEANSHGARDIERSLHGAEDRVVVLGDSFVEGPGVEIGDRLTEQLEALTSREHLNFGTSGDFGPTQYYLLYRHLAREFTHGTVVVGVLPVNDFNDDSYEFGRQALWDRYRPYWVGDFPDYELVYFKESLDRPGDAPNLTADFTLLDMVKESLRSYTYTYNVLSYLRKYASVSAASERPQVYSGFYDFTQDELHRTVYSIGRISAAAGDRRVVVALFPSPPDFTRYDGQPETPLASAMRAFAGQYGFEVIDLLPPMSRGTDDWRSYFHTCDAHWNDLGHRKAAEVLAGRF
jgi:hypothetical protein